MRERRRPYSAQTGADDGGGGKSVKREILAREVLAQGEFARFEMPDFSCCKVLLFAAKQLIVRSFQLTVFSQKQRTHEISIAQKFCEVVQKSGSAASPG